MQDGLASAFRADGAAILAAGAALIALLFLAARGSRAPRRRDGDRERVTRSDRQLTP